MGVGGDRLDSSMSDPAGDARGALIQPTASVAAGVRHDCRAWRDARSWSARADRSTSETVLPDLSRDVVLTEQGPVLLPRSLAAFSVPLDPRRTTHGLRLPVAATRVRLDPQWAGWRSGPVGDGDPTVLWRAAWAEGALSWTVDPRQEALLRLLDVPDVRVSDVAAAVHQSERTLRRYCLGWFGASPVALPAIMSGWRFLREVAAGRTATAAAASAGYCDVAHASRAMRQFAAGTPDWTRARLAD